MSRNRKHAVMLPKGVAVIRRKGGRIDYYWYPGRNTPAAEWLKEQWCKLPGTPEAPEFWQAIKRAKEGGATRDGKMAAMIDAYRASAKWGKLSERTRRDYNRYLDDLRATFGHVDPREFGPEHVSAIQEQHADTPSKADHYVAVIRALYKWGVSKRHASANPAREIEPIAEVEPYEPWPQWAWELVPLMREELRTACFLALYTGQRLGDVLRMQLGDVQDGRIAVKQGKTGKKLVIALHPELAPIVRECRERGRIYLVSKANGDRYTEDQFHAAWGREKRKEAIKPLAAAEPRLVFHGLRKSATCKLIEAGCTPSEVASVTGMSLQMVEHYSKKVDQLRLADSAIGKMVRA